MNVEFCEDNSNTSKKMRYFRKNKVGARAPPLDPPLAIPPGQDASPLQATAQHSVRPPQQFAGTHLYSWVERGTVGVKCLAQEHNTVTPARAQT